MATTYFVKYTVFEKSGKETTFVVGPRLDMYIQEKHERLEKYGIKIEGALSVTDRLVKTNDEFPRWAWFPWIEGKYPTEEVVFGSLNILRHWVENLNLKTIYIHCAAGSHRSPTIMGFYLVAFRDYITSFKMEPMFDCEVSEGEKHYFSPAMEYADSYLERDFGENYKLLLPAIAENFYGKNTFLEDVLDNLGWKKGFPAKRQRSCFEE